MSFHRAAMLLVIAAGVLSSIEAEAQARGRPVTESRLQTGPSTDSAKGRAQQLADLHAWLGRLVGRFLASSSLHMGVTDLGGGNLIFPDPPQSYVLQCIPIGSGSGVLCLYEATDGTFGELPRALLFGVDAERLGIRALELGDKGHASDYFGSLNGETASLERECQAAGNCTGLVTMRIRARPGSRTVELYREADVKLSRGTFRAAPMRSWTELRRQ